MCQYQSGCRGLSHVCVRVQMVALAVGGVVVGAMTAGVGLVAPMVVVGITAAAGSGATVYGVSVPAMTFWLRESRRLAD